jgi:hypothetical protein
MLCRTPRRSPVLQPRQRTKIGTRHSSKYASTVDTALPLKVMTSNPSGEEQEEVETELNGISRAPTPFVSRVRVLVS